MIINNLPAGGGRRSLIVDGVEFRKEHGARKVSKLTPNVKFLKENEIGKSMP